MEEINKLIIAGWIEFGLLLTPLLFGALDFISGRRKAILRGEKISSNRLRDSVKKVSGYYNMLLALAVVDIMHISCSWFLNTYYAYSIPMFPFITLGGAFVVAAIEIISIREKADEKMKKQVNDLASLLASMAKNKDDLGKVIDDVGTFLKERDEAINNSTNNKETEK